MVQPPALLAWALPLAVGLGATFVYHRLTLLSGLDLVQSVENDSLFIGFVLEHWHRALGGEVPWHSPAIYFPVPRVLGNSDALLALALPYHLLRLAGLHPFQALNATSVLLTLGAFGSSYLLLRRFFGASLVASCAAAVFFATSHPRFSQQVHVQLQFLVLLPLQLWVLLYLLRHGLGLSRVRLFVLALAGGLLLVLQGATSVYIGWLAALLSLVLVAIGCLWRPFRRQLLRLVARGWYVLLAAAALSLLSAWPVLSLYLDHPIRWSYEVIVQQMPTPTHLLQLSQESLLWGSLLPDLPPVGDDRGLGVGAVFTLFWLFAVAAALRWLIQNRAAPETSAAADPPRIRALICLLLLSSLVLLLFGLRYGQSSSPWWLVYQTIPGAGGVRVVARLILILTLPVAVAAAWGHDALLAAARGGRWRWPVTVAAPALLLLGLVEQQGTIISYSGGTRYQQLKRLAHKVSRSCPTFLFKHGPLPQSRRESFDAEGYLDANPDLRQPHAWKGTAWEHYHQHGRQQCRFVDERAIYTAIAVHLQAMWVSALTGVPTLNGYSAKHPEGWPFHNLSCDGFNRGLQQWLRQRSLTARPCVVQIPP